MRAAFATLAFAALAAASPKPSGTGAVTSAIAPQQSPPPDCYPNYDGTFVISPTNFTTSKRDLNSLDERNTELGITLQNGILTDPQGRTGYIAANEQFQFDGPPQAGAIYTAGFTVCLNGSLALGNTAIWYRCLSGSFYNLYFENQGKQCIPSLLSASKLNGTGPEPGSLTGYGTITATNNGTTSTTGSSSSTGVVSTTGKNSTMSATTSTKVVAPKTTASATMTSSSSAAASSSSMASSSASATASSSTGGAAGPAKVGGEMFGLAAGLLAMAMF